MKWMKSGKNMKRTCKHCGYSNLYVQCAECLQWKTKLQVKAGFK